MIPAGTPMSCISVFKNYDADIFPNPRQFRPERWLQSEEVSSYLGKHLVAFEKGTRSCLGYNLGMVELYLTLAHVLTRFDMQLFETGARDVDLERDWFIPQPAADSAGIRVIVAKASKDP